MAKRKQENEATLPTERDFDPIGCDLDAQCAWKNFGGLTLDDAKVKFRENALCCQEDFMFMGCKAFAFYFPVIEDYLLSAPDVEDDDDYEAWILSQCIQAQFERDNVGDIRHLADHAIELADFVRQNIRRFGATDEERCRIADAWTDMVGHVEAYMKRSL